MDERRWQAIQSVFDQVVDLPPADQRAAVAELTAGDAPLAEEVLTLLAEDARANPLLDEGLGHAARGILDPAELTSIVPRQIGAYRLLELLGEGGMGVVYLAERTDIGGRVAIKFLRDAWLSPMRRERFATEQRTLAQLNHPAIARIYDSGALEDGTPWFVMEYAEAVPLTEYWKSRATTVRDCLRLFRRVCEAVEYAHQHAVIHRDLKPSNILATAAGEIKLLDFGIAKQLMPDAGASDRTLAGLLILTPAYAAPEQMTGGALGMYTDVYALGVILYELLTGQPPFSPGREELDTAVLLRAREAVKKPSLLAPPNPPALLTQPARGEWADLDALCLTALRIDPRERYRSVDAMIRDVDAFLEGRPLSAQPTRFRYRAGKFVRRHRRSLAAIAATLLLIVAAAAFFTVRLARARAAAVAEAERTRRIQQFTEDLFDGGDKSAGPSGEMKVTELLDRGRQQAASLEHDPEVQADMRATLGGIYQKLGKLDQAQPLLESALEARQHLAADRKTADRKTAESLVALGLLRKDQGKLDDAEKLVRQGLAVQQRALPAGDADTLKSLVALGSILETHGRYDAARGAYKNALQQRKADAAPTAELVENLTGLANVDFYQGNYDASEAENRRALAIGERLFGENHPMVAKQLNNLGAIETQRGRYPEAEAYYRRAVAICRAWYGEEHPETAANEKELASSLIYQKRYDEPEGLLRQALATQEKLHGRMNQAVALVLNEMGALSYARDQDDAALPLYREALEIFRGIYGDNHQFVAVAYSNMGSVYLDKKDYVSAENMYREAVKRSTAAVPGENMNTAVARLKLGRALLRQGRYAEAEVETSDAYRYLQKQVVPTNNFLMSARKDLVAIYTGLRQPETAAYYQAELAAVSPKN